MRYCFILFLSLFVTNTYCQNTDRYTVPDSIKAIGLYAEIKITNDSGSKNFKYGISTAGASLGLGRRKKEKIISFDLFKKVKAWNYDWSNTETYPLLILTASDSALHRSLYSGYIYLPIENKWKLIATHTYRDTIKLKYLWAGFVQAVGSGISHTNRWLLRSNGTWKALDSQTTKPPSLRHMSNIDSLFQQKLEEDMLRSKLPKDSVSYEDGVFYQSLKEGTGRLVKVSDTLTVHYKGSLYSDGSVFDQTKEKPATFPLERLIKGWQLGLVHCKVGGKMRLFITSGSAYGIRTRSATIPPNSILVFDVEVLDAKEKIIK